MTQLRDCKYPHSANLFSFCKNVLSIKFGNARVIDQDVGQILDFDPADCSHWKRGRKNIRSFVEIKAISEKLGVDEGLILDVASGEVSDSEAMLELHEMRSASTPREVVANLSLIRQKVMGQRWTNEWSFAVEEYLDVEEKRICELVKEMHLRMGFQEAPFFFPELWSAYPAIKIIERSIPENAKNAMGDILPRLHRGLDGRTEILVTSESINRPRTRFSVAKLIATIFTEDLTDSRLPFLHANQRPVICQYLQSFFARRLLVPSNLLRDELKKIDLTKDIVVQLAEVFWVSRHIMNRRLKDLLVGDIV